MVMRKNLTACLVSDLITLEKNYFFKSICTIQSSISETMLHTLVPSSFLTVHTELKHFQHSDLA